MVSPTRQVKPGYVVTYPNRDKRSSRVTRIAVAIVLVVSALLILVVTVGGWSRLDGLEAVNLTWCLLYLVMAFYVIRWAREPLPFAVGLGALMLTFAMIALTAAAGVSWSDRNGPGYAPTHSLFGGEGLSPDSLSALTTAVAVTQAVLICGAVQALRQAWNIEYEVPAAEAATARA